MTTTTSQSAAQPKKRVAITPPAAVSETMTLWDYLRECTPPLDQKIIDIACSQTGVPTDLHPDAEQEISLQWSLMKPDTKRYKPGQIASYAHRMARHAALRVRRELGSTVRLPGSAFRKRKDGSSYVTPGVLAAAIDWNELEGWFQTDDLVDGGAALQASGDMSGLREMFEQNDMGTSEAVFEEDEEELERKERRETLEANKDALTVRQFRVMTLLVDGESLDDIMASMSIKKGVLMREIAVASSVIGIS